MTMPGTSDRQSPEELLVWLRKSDHRVLLTDSVSELLHISFAFAFLRSIDSGGENHVFRFERIAKSDLQGNSRPTKPANTITSSPPIVHGFGVLHERPNSISRSKCSRAIGTCGEVWAPQH